MIGKESFWKERMPIVLSRVVSNPKAWLECFLLFIITDDRSFLSRSTVFPYRDAEFGNSCVFVTNAFRLPSFDIIYLLGPHPCVMDVRYKGRTVASSYGDTLMKMFTSAFSFTGKLAAGEHVAAKKETGLLLREFAKIYYATSSFVDLPVGGVSGNPLLLAKHCRLHEYKTGKAIT